MDRHAALEIVRTTLAADCACRPDDWDRDAVTIVEAREVAGRRRFPFRANEFHMVTMGRGVVIACSAARLPWVEANLRHRSRDELFATPTLALISNFVQPDQQVLAGPHLWHICTRASFCPATAPAGYRLETFTQARITEVYRYRGFDHALSYDTNRSTPDVIAVVARHHGEVVGIAGVGADNDQLWQIGIDVVPGHQGLGLGKALVSRATEAVFEHGRTPYYAHNIGNVRSGNTARTVGFQWAWTSTYVRNV